MRDYDELRMAARGWIDQVVAQIESTRPTLARDGEDARLVRLFRRRKFGEFRRRVRVRSPLEKALLEFFLLARIRSYVLAYLSVQEGDDFEGQSEKETQAPLLIAQMLRSSGRRSGFGLRLGWRRWRFFLDLDPLCNLRKLYALEVLGERRQIGGFRHWIARLRHVWGFRCRTKLAGTFFRRVMRRASRGGAGWESQLLWKRSDLRRLIALTLLMLFPETKSLDQSGWLRLLGRLQSYFAPRLEHLRRTIPADSVANHGFVKLFKVAFGTVVGRVAARSEFQAETEDFVFDTLRAAYSWGITYPLVDNVLDSESTAPRVREELLETLKAVFAGRSLDETTTASLRSRCSCTAADRSVRSTSTCNMRL